MARVVVKPARGDGDRLRIELLVAAADLIGTHGEMESVSLRAVARRAGVSVALALPSAVGLQLDRIEAGHRLQAGLDDPGALRELPPDVGFDAVFRRLREAIVIPEECLVPQGDRQFVFVVDQSADNTVERREVRIGTRRPGEVEIPFRLTESQEVLDQVRRAVDQGQHQRLGLGTARVDVDAVARAHHAERLFRAHHLGMVDVHPARPRFLRRVHGNGPAG